MQNMIGNGSRLMLVLMRMSLSMDNIDRSLLPGSEYLSQMSVRGVRRSAQVKAKNGLSGDIFYFDGAFGYGARQNTLTVKSMVVLDLQFISS